MDAAIEATNELQKIAIKPVNMDKPAYIRSMIEKEEKKAADAD